MTSATAATTPRWPQRRMNRLGLGLFLLSEAFLFMVLLGSRFLLVGTQTPEAVSQTLGFGLTVLLVASSVTAHRAGRAIAAGDNDLARRQVWWTMGLAVVFLVIVVIEWNAAFVEFPVSTVYGSLFILITGTHALHLFIGVVMFGFLDVHLRTGQITPADNWGAEATIWYWHFVDVVWLSVFTTLYLVG